MAGRHTILTLRIKKVLHLARWGETAALGSCFFPVSQRCHGRRVLTDVFRGIEEKAEQELNNTTLADCMQRMKKEIDKE